jgi:hypothetical protein
MSGRATGPERPGSVWRARTRRARSCPPRRSQPRGRNRLCERLPPLDSRGYRPWTHSLVPVVLGWSSCRQSSKLPCGSTAPTTGAPVYLDPDWRTTPSGPRRSMLAASPNDWLLLVSLPAAAPAKATRYPPFRLADRTDADLIVMSTRAHRSRTDTDWQHRGCW